MCSCFCSLFMRTCDIVCKERDFSTVLVLLSTIVVVYCEVQGFNPRKAWPCGDSKKRYGHVGLFGSVPSHAEEKKFLCFRPVFWINLYWWFVKMTITYIPLHWWLKTTAGENFLYTGGGKLQPVWKIPFTLGVSIGDLASNKRNPWLNRRMIRHQLHCNTPQAPICHIHRYRSLLLPFQLYYLGAGIMWTPPLPLTNMEGNPLQRLWVFLFSIFRFSPHRSYTFRLLCISPLGCSWRKQLLWIWPLKSLRPWTYSTATFFQIEDNWCLFYVAGTSLIPLIGEASLSHSCLVIMWLIHSPLSITSAGIYSGPVATAGSHRF